MPSSRLIKTATTAILATLPIAARTFVPEAWQPALVPATLLVALIGYWIYFKPDGRFQRVRGPALDVAFDALISEEFGHKEPENQIPSLRVHVYTRTRSVFGERLVLRYAYRSEPSLPDFGLAWPSGRGLVWQAVRSGRTRYAKNGDQDWNASGLTPKHERATEHVKSVLVIPLRRPVDVEEQSERSRVFAVLAFDALDEQAADILRSQYQRLLDGQNKKLVDRAGYVSLYFW